METNTEDKEFFIQVGQRVKERRRELGVTQETLAELAGVHLTYISRVENGKYNVSTLIYKRIALALEMPLSELLDVDVKGGVPDELTKAVIQIKALGKKEQKMMIKALQGLLAGMKG